MHVEGIDTVVREGIVYNDDEDERELCVKLTRAIYLKLNKHKIDNMFDRQTISEVMMAREADRKGYVVIVDVLNDKRWQILVRRDD